MKPTREELVKVFFLGASPEEVLSKDVSPRMLAEALLENGMFNGETATALAKFAKRRGGDIKMGMVQEMAKQLVAGAGKEGMDLMEVSQLMVPFVGSKSMTGTVQNVYQCLHHLSRLKSVVHENGRYKVV